MSEDGFLPVKQGLRNNALAVCRMLLPGGVKDGHRWRCGGVTGEKGESLAVYLPEGSWKDFATGEAGDLIDLWAASRSVALMEARDEAAEWLGLATKKNGTEHHKPQPITIRSEQTNVVPIVTKEQGPAPTGEPDQVWNYLDHNGDVVFRTARWNGKNGTKTIRPQHYNGRGFTIGLPARFAGAEPDKQPLLYRHSLLTAKTIVFVEGEKACDAVIEAGYVATTNQGGAQNLDKQEWEMLNGADLIIWRDNDAPGQEWQEKLLEIVRTKLRVRSCHTVAMPAHFKDKWDAADVSIEERQAILNATFSPDAPKPFTPNTASRSLVSIGGVSDKPIEPQKWLMDGVMPAGTMSMWAAEGGLGKSMLSLDLAARVCLPPEDFRRNDRFLKAKINNFGRAYILSLEDRIDDIRRRLKGIYGDHHAEMFGDRFLVNSMQDIIADNPGYSSSFVDRDPSTGKYKPSQTYLDIRDTILSVRDLELIVIDPLYAIAPGLLTEPGAMAVLTAELTALAAKTNAAFLLVHHFTKIPSTNAMKSKEELKQIVAGTAQVVNAMRKVDVFIESRAYKLPGQKVVEYVPVKCNLEHSEERRYLLREDGGLLVDRTDRVKAEADSQILRQASGFADAVKKAAKDGKPFAAFWRNNKSAFKRKRDLPKDMRKVTRELFEEIQEQALTDEYVVTVDGTRNTSWLDVPGGPYHSGELIA